MTLKRRFKKKYASELLQVAREDLESARVLADGKVSRKENILFHVQQAVEKSLKAVLCAREQEVPLVHDLNELLNALENPEEVPHQEGLFELTQFATIRRYEEGVALFTSEEIAASIRVGAEVIVWATADLKKQGLES